LRCEAQTEGDACLTQMRVPIAGRPRRHAARVYPRPCRGNPMIAMRS
jgi:hypothetical protein